MAALDGYHVDQADGVSCVRRGRSSCGSGSSPFYVTDQDAARAFYTEKLGFVLRDDAPYGPDFRWLTVVSSEDDVTELYLAHQNRYKGARAYREAMYEEGVPVVGFSTEDIDALRRSLTDKGVTFTSEPAEAGYGGINAVIDDGCGNLLNLHQEAAR
jgi:catechol 2,3-dioxygenase-like lactoylglutathione lyase family enzyme